MTRAFPVADQKITCAGFSAVGSSIIDPVFVKTPVVGTGVGYSQATGSLLVTTGTTANAEFLARSIRAFSGSMRLRFTLIASQRIANANFGVILADLVGERLAVTINSATSITVAIPNHSFTAENVGQFVYVGGIVGAAGVPGRYAIASVVAGVSINLTVSGWPASGSATATLFGRNYISHIFTGTTATAVDVDAQRNGWATGATAATINTTASPGTLIQTEFTGRDVFFSDSLRASSTTPNFTTRASRYENIPDDNVALHLFLWSFNGSTAPASTTTWTLGHVVVEEFENLPVYVQGNRAVGQQNALPVALQAGANAIGSLASGANLVGDVGQQYRAAATGAASVASVLSPVTPAATQIKATGGKVVGGNLQNSSTAIRSVKFFNSTAAGVTLGTTSAAFEVDIPAGGEVQIGPFEGGLGFATAISYAVTGAKGLTDNTATGLAANDVSGFIAFA